VSKIINFWIPLAILVIWLFMAIIGPILPLDPNKVRLQMILQTPSFEEIFGYDDLGRSLFDRIVVGSRTSLTVAFAVVCISVTMGSLIGSVSGFVGGKLDQIIVLIIDIFLAFPGILLAISLAGIMGPGIDNVIIALSIVGWVGFARLARVQVLSLKQREHVQAALALGTSYVRIFTRHLLPLISAPLIIEASFGIASVIIAEAGLSFLGLGVQPPAASWGSIIRDGAHYLLVAPHMVIVPGLSLACVVVAVNLLGDHLRDRLDVKN